MAQTYFIILTLLGKAKVAEAIANGTDIGLSQVAVGDGDYTPSEGQTALVSEKYRAGANQVYRDEPENPNWIVVELVIPAQTGGWNVREVGIFDTAGDLFAIGKYAPTYKPTFDEGSGKELVIRAILEISSQANVTVTVDPSVVLATRDYVDGQIDADVAAHEAKDSAHPASKISFNPAPAGLTANRVQGAVEEVAAALGTVVPAGSMMWWPTEAPPSGWLVRNGAQLSMTTYKRIYLAFGRAIYGKPAGSTFTANAATDLLAATAHGLAVGDIVEFTSTGTLPGGLTANTTYYVVFADTATFKVSLTEGGAPVDITSAGSGTLRFCRFFYLPDDRGQFIRGWANGTGNDPDRATRNDRGDGTTGDHVGTLQGSMYTSHTHQIGAQTRVIQDVGTTLYGLNGVSQYFNSTANGGNETRPINRAYLPIIKY